MDSGTKQDVASTTDTIFRANEPVTIHVKSSFPFNPQMGPLPVSPLPGRLYISGLKQDSGIEVLLTPRTSGRRMNCPSRPFLLSEVVARNEIETIRPVDFIIVKPCTNETRPVSELWTELLLYRMLESTTSPAYMARKATLVLEMPNGTQVASESVFVVEHHEHLLRRSPELRELVDEQFQTLPSDQVNVDNYVESFLLQLAILNTDWHSYANGFSHNSSIFLDSTGQYQRAFYDFDLSRFVKELSDLKSSNRWKHMGTHYFEGNFSYKGLTDYTVEKDLQIMRDFCSKSDKKFKVRPPIEAIGKSCNRIAKRYSEDYAAKMQKTVDQFPDVDAEVKEAISQRLKTLLEAVNLYIADQSILSVPR